MNKRLNQFGVVVLTFALCSVALFGQNVNIPNATFKAYLIGNSELNSNMDSEIQVSEAAAYSGRIDLIGARINDLTGIEAFTALTALNCRGNELAVLDLSNNTALTWLDCSNNYLKVVDVSKNTALTELACGSNNLTNLDLSKLTLLTALNCQNSSLLKGLNLRNSANGELNKIHAHNNPQLTCIQVDDPAYSMANWTNPENYIFPTDVEFSLDCSGVSSIEDRRVSDMASFPNPATGSVAVSTPTGSGQYQVHDASGKLITEGTVAGLVVNVNMQNLPSGMYFITVVDGNTQAQTKVVKK